MFTVWDDEDTLRTLIVPWSYW